MQIETSDYIEKQANNVVLPFDKPNKEYTIESIGEVPRKPIYSAVKRLFDILVSFVGLLILIVPMAIVALCIMIDTPGGAIYKQERLGLNGKKFYMYKFRTMYADAEKNGAQWSTGKNDSRVTSLGRILRRTKIDELPQLYNCLVGDISLVGPRPERGIFYEKFETYVHGFSQRLKVKPGITGLAQIKGGYFAKPEEKVLYDIEYIKTRSVWLDIKILFGTVIVIFNGNVLK